MGRFFEQLTAPNERSLLMIQMLQGDAKVTRDSLIANLQKVDVAIAESNIIIQENETERSKLNSALRSLAELESLHTERAHMDSYVWSYRIGGICISCFLIATLILLWVFYPLECAFNSCASYLGTTLWIIQFVVWISISAAFNPRSDGYGIIFTAPLALCIPAYFGIARLDTVKQRINEIEQDNIIPPSAYGSI